MKKSEGTPRKKSEATPRQSNQPENRQGSWIEQLFQGGGIDLFGGCACNTQQRALESGVCNRFRKPEGELDITQKDAKPARFNPSSRSSASTDMPHISSSSGEDRQQGRILSATNETKACPKEDDEDDLQRLKQGLQFGQLLHSPDGLQFGAYTLPGSTWSPPKKSPIPLPSSNVASPIKEVREEATVESKEAPPRSPVESAKEEVTAQSKEAPPLVEQAKEVEEEFTSESKEALPPVEEAREEVKEETTAQSKEPDQFGEFQAAFRMDTNDDGDAHPFGEYQAAFTLIDDDETGNVEQAVVGSASRPDSLPSDSVEEPEAVGRPKLSSFIQESSLTDGSDDKVEELPRDSYHSNLSAETITGALAGAIDAEYRYVRGSLHSGGVPVSTDGPALDFSLGSTEGPILSVGEVDCRSDESPQSRSILLDEASMTAETIHSEGSIHGDHESATKTRLSDDLLADEVVDVMKQPCTTCEGYLDHQIDAVDGPPCRPPSDSEETMKVEQLALEELAVEQDSATMLLQQGSNTLREQSCVSDMPLEKALELVRTACREVLASDLEDDAELMQFGLNSISALELRSQLATSLPNKSLPLNLAFYCPSIRVLAMRLVDEACMPIETIHSPVEGSVHGDRESLAQTRLSEDLPSDEAVDVLSPMCITGEGYLDRQSDAADGLLSRPCSDIEVKQRVEPLAIGQGTAATLSKQGETQLSSSKSAERWARFLLCRCGSICS